MDEPTALLADDVSVWFGARQVLDHVSLAIPRGRITAILGPSGSGKSTLLRLWNGMNQRTPGFRFTGRILVGDTPVGRRADFVDLRRRVGMVFQRPIVLPTSIFENVALGLRIHGYSGRHQVALAVADSLRRAFLWEEVRGRLDQPATELSGGQQQRLCIARALAIQPEVLLMDEPASALDPTSTARIEDLCQSLAGAYTVVVVTHNIQQAARISHHTAVLLDGRLTEWGSTSQVFTAPGDPRTEQYITGRIG